MVNVITRIFFLGMAFVLLHITGAFHVMVVFAVRVQGILHKEVYNMYCINTKNTLIKRFLIKRMKFILHIKLFYNWFT